MISRKEFLRKSAVLAAGSTLPLWLNGVSTKNPGPPDLTILYTNDTHARLDPFPENSLEFSGLGGIARRSSLVKKIRSEVDHVLLVDAGDVFQGTSWFDLYGGSVDFELMTEMKYDAMAVGNHEFDRGPDGFAEAARKAGFPILAANYKVRNTPMNPYVQRFTTKEYKGFRVGIFGLGIPLEGVVAPELRGDVISRRPEAWANGMVRSLREVHNCDFVICLSHLGYHYKGSRMDDLKLARNVTGIDLIIGAHTHTFLDNPVYITNPSGKHTLITQMGHSGVRLGRLDLYLDSAIHAFEIKSKYYVVGRSEA
ncbi:bifunctional metallophosphatase/5'-nucleotidase [Rhodohalobacter mucosus]|nr:metallophosphoesterase [Rhodohalobacter mucosus]